jgi:hypothetical protein
MRAPLLLLAMALAITLSTLGCTQSHVPCGEDYASCETMNSCASGTSCMQFVWRDGRGTICSRSCERETDCPREAGYAGRCIDANASGQRLCFRECSSDDDCPASWVCQPIVNQRGEGGAVCLP